MERTVELTIDGKKVPMNDFIRSLLSEVTVAMVKPLHGVDATGEIEIKVGPGEKE